MEALKDVPHKFVDITSGCLDLRSTPPPGVYLVRPSPSSHTRGHRFAIEHTINIVQWLEVHGRTVLNGSKALRLETSKVYLVACVLCDYGHLHVFRQAHNS